MEHHKVSEVSAIVCLLFHKLDFLVFTSSSSSNSKCKYSAPKALALDLLCETYIIFPSLSKICYVIFINFSFVIAAFFWFYSHRFMSMQICSFQAWS
jgi:hypothetical protein